MGVEKELRSLLCAGIALASMCFYSILWTPPIPLKASEVWRAASFNTFWEEWRNGREMMWQKTPYKYPRRNQAPR